MITNFYSANAENSNKKLWFYIHRTSPVNKVINFYNIPEAHGVRVNWDDDAGNDVGAVESVSVPRYPYLFPVSYAPYRGPRF